jgi:uncharacterized protein with NAD-binding domain and iron-sulfur cluster
MSKKVIILGGGVAGMSAAHELCERGFEVEVYERNQEYVGGKARSVDVPGTNTQFPDKYLPGEHGFRFFPGFYKHVTDTMKRIPTGNGKTVFDNLVTTESVAVMQIGAMPIISPLHFPTSVKDIVQLFTAFKEVKAELTHEEIHYFSSRVWQLMTSCSDRFYNEYESIGWWEFMGADKFSKSYRELLVEGLTRSLVAAKANLASTKTVGAVFLQLLYTIIPIYKSGTDRVLNAPTNDAWLTPWLNYLHSMKVAYFKNHQVISISIEKGVISGAIVKDLLTGIEKTVTGDYYILATPVEVAAQLINEKILEADPCLQNIIKLAPNVSWMNGIQFYLNKDFKLHRGHTIYAASNWALTSISQIQFWGDYDLKDRYNGQVKGILSVDISDWTVPGNFNNKAAQDCTLEEVKEEVWKQIKQEVNIKQEILTDDMIVLTFLDEDIQPQQPDQNTMKAVLSESKYEKVIKLANREPLLVNYVDTWDIRPPAFTDIPNLFLASDYVKTYTDLATMEGANEAARRAVNNIIKISGCKAKYCKIWKLNNPLPLRILQMLDKRKFRKGMKWSNPL